MRLRFMVAMLLAGCAVAQQGTPHAGYVYPAGGQRGTSFEAVVGGETLNGANAVMVTGSGVKVSVVEFVRPINPGQANTMRDQLKALMEKQRGVDANGKPVGAAVTLTDSEEREVHDLRLKLLTFEKQRATNTAIAEKVRVKISVAGDAALGQHELRLVTANGVTNPIYFVVGQLPEWTKTAAGAIEDSDLEGQLRLFNKNKGENATPTPVVAVNAPVVINGQVGPGGVDRYRFKARTGEPLVVAASARELIPYIADAVPGWFQASLTLYDSGGKEVEYADHYTFHPDPTLLYRIPADGEYTLAIHDSIYRGREDFVYRVALGELPYVTGMFPLGGRAGAKTQVEFTGWNLSQTRMTELSKAKEAGVEMLAPEEAELNARPFALDLLPESMAKEQNHTRASAQKIAVPVIVNGRVNKPGEWEYFEFKGKAGKDIEAEVFARRLGSPLDSILTLMDASGKVLAVNDDFVDESAGLVTDQADSRIRYTLPADGNYYLRLGDTQRNSGAEYAYRLKVSPPQPDFELRITPSSINAHAGEIVPITVHALRLGGFTGDIVVKLKGGGGYQLSGDVIPGNQSEVKMTLAIPEEEKNGESHLSVNGFATVGGKQVERKGMPADDWEQAFFYHHLVTTNELLVAMSGRQMRQVEWSKGWSRALELLQGGTVGLKFEVPALMVGDKKYQLEDPPPGITLDRTVPFDGGVVLYLKADKAKAAAGLRGNLILSMTVEKPGQKGKAAAQTLILPALPFAVIARVPRADATHETAALQAAK